MIMFLIAFTGAYALTLATTGSQWWATASGLLCVVFACARR